MQSVRRCFGRWRVELSDALRRELGRDPQLLERVEKRARELEEELNSDPHAIHRLLREPVVYEEPRVRRMRVGNYRVFFVVDVEGCRVVLLAVRHRRSAYRDLRKRFR